MSDETKTKAGVMWYRRDQWERWKEVTPDWDEMSPTYDAWLREAKRGIRLYEEQGLAVEKVHADVDEFLAWCRYKGLEPNGAARSQYAADHVRRKSHSQG